MAASLICYLSLGQLDSVVYVPGIWNSMLGIMGYLAWKFESFFGTPTHSSLFISPLKGYF